MLIFLSELRSDHRESKLTPLAIAFYVIKGVHTRRYLSPPGISLGKTFYVIKSNGP